MRIAVFDNVPEGGAKRVVYEHIRFLARSHEVGYFTGSRSQSFSLSDAAALVKEYTFSQVQRHGLERPLTEWWLWRTLPRIYREIAGEIAAFKPAVVLVHPCRFTQSPLLLQFLHAPSLYYIEEPLRVVYELELHSIEPLSFLKRWYEHGRRRLLKQLDKASLMAATALVANSRFTASNVKHLYGRKARVLHPGVDTQQFQANFQRSRRKHFLFVGSLDAINGYDLLPTALSHLPPIVTVASKAKELRLSEAELVRLYHDAIATLCLGRREPFGLVPLESMATGTPVIALDEGGYVETVRHGETGLLVEPEPGALLQAMELLATDVNLWESMSRKGADYTRKHFTWEQHGQALESMLGTLISES